METKVNQGVLKLAATPIGLALRLVNRPQDGERVYRAVNGEYCVGGVGLANGVQSAFRYLDDIGMIYQSDNGEIFQSRLEGFDF